MKKSGFGSKVILAIFDQNDRAWAKDSGRWSTLSLLVSFFVALLVFLTNPSLIRLARESSWAMDYGNISVWQLSLLVGLAVSFLASIFIEAVRKRVAIQNIFKDLLSRDSTFFAIGFLFAGFFTAFLDIFLGLNKYADDQVLNFLVVFCVVAGFIFFAINNKREKKAYPSFGKRLFVVNTKIIFASIFFLLGCCVAILIDNILLASGVQGDYDLLLSGVVFFAISFSSLFLFFVISLSACFFIAFFVFVIPPIYFFAIFLISFAIKIASPYIKRKLESD
jgi:hypothetical protein